MKALNGKSHPWLERTGQVWKYDLEGYLGFFGFFASGLFLLSLVASIFIRRAWLIGLALFGAYFLLGFFSIYIFYYRIRCPHCGHNPTRKTDGRWASTRFLTGKLQKMEYCPICERNEPTSTQAKGA
jgi:hypothetical protein